MAARGGGETNARLFLQCDGQVVEVKNASKGPSRGSSRCCMGSSLGVFKSTTSFLSFICLGGFKFHGHLGRGCTRKEWQGHFQGEGEIMHAPILEDEGKMGKKQGRVADLEPAHRILGILRKKGLKTQCSRELLEKVTAHLLGDRACVCRLVTLAVICIQVISPSGFNRLQLRECTRYLEKLVYPKIPVLISFQKPSWHVI